MRHIPMKDEIDGEKETLADGLPRRHHPHPRHLDAPGRHRQGHRHSRWSSPASTTVASSPTRPPSGAAATASPARSTSPARSGGTFAQGDGGEEITIDAVDFCRILSGRGTGEGLLAAARSRF